MTETHNCHQNQICKNTRGSYLCECKDFYTFSGTEGNEGSCVDIDECFTETHNCPDDSLCNNIDGGYECLDSDKNKPGFEENGNFPTCKDPVRERCDANYL